MVNEGNRAPSKFFLALTPPQIAYSAAVHEPMNGV